MIKYGISRDYLPDWGYAEALREIYQNFNDYGDFREEKIDVCGQGYDYEITLSNNYSPDNLNFLSVGYSAKRYDNNTVGEHGEGLKMALLVLAREGVEVVLNAGTKKLTPMFYNDDYLGECFGIDIVEMGYSTHNFSLRFIVPSIEYDTFKGIQIDEEEIIFSHRMGEIIKKAPGSIYVGGIFIAVLENMKYAYNFKPEHISLDRDRKVPRSFDVEYTASRIMEDWDQLSIEDLGKRDAAYISRIPTRIRKAFAPELVNNEVVFRSGETQAQSSLLSTLKEYHHDTISGLKLKSNRIRKPENMLRKYLESHGRNMTSDQRIDFAVLLSESKNWVKKNKTIG